MNGCYPEVFQIKVFLNVPTGKISLFSIDFHLCLTNNRFIYFIKSVELIMVHYSSLITFIPNKNTRIKSI